MSFSAETKNELARVISNDDYCNKTELAAIVRLAGSIQIAGYRKLNLKIILLYSLIIRRLLGRLMVIFGLEFFNILIISFICSSFMMFVSLL